MDVAQLSKCCGCDQPSLAAARVPPASTCPTTPPPLPRQCEGIVLLASALCVNHTLRHLDVEDNGIRDTGACALGKALASNDTLQALCLKGNKLSDSAARGLADGLKLNRGLTALDLQGRTCDSPKIGTFGARCLYQALQVNATVQSINLAANRVGPQGMSAIHREFPCVDRRRMLVRKERTLEAVRTPEPPRKRFLFF